MAAAKQKQQRLLAALAIMLLALLLGPAAGQLPCFAGWLPVLGKFSVCPNPFAAPSQGGQPTGKGLSEDHYYKKDSYCPRAEEIVRAAVEAGTENNRGLNAAFIRLHFHDCFVRGCDASVLLDRDEDFWNTEPEKDGPPNKNSLRGFDLIEAAKTEVEKVCPGKVSCADILAMAARDAFYLLTDRKSSYKVYLGRLDGRKSRASETNQLPGPDSTLTQLIASFKAQGLDQIRDLVALSGAHTVGQARCMFANRQNKMDSDCVSKVQASCDGRDATTTTVALDNRTPVVMDNQYFTNIPGCVLFNSDAALMDSSETSAKVREYAADNGKWWYDFGEAMRKMGNITANPPSGVEIRKVCSQIN